MVINARDLSKRKTHKARRTAKKGESGLNPYALIEQYSRLGFNPAGFWELTPRDYEAAINGALDRLDRDADRGIITAWRIANFTRAKKLKPLKEYLKRKKTAGALNADAGLLRWADFIKGFPKK